MTDERERERERRSLPPSVGWHTATMLSRARREFRSGESATYLLVFNLTAVFAPTWMHRIFDFRPGRRRRLSSTGRQENYSDARKSRTTDLITESSARRWERIEEIGFFQKRSLMPARGGIIAPSCKRRIKRRK